MLQLLSNSSTKGILPINDDTIQKLHEKHPNEEPLNDVLLLYGPVKKVHSDIFDEFNADLVHKVILKTKII